MRFSQYVQYICRVTLIVIGCSLIVSSARAQNTTAQRGSPAPADQQRASSPIAVAQSRAADDLTDTPAEARLAPNRVNDPPIASESKGKGNISSAKVEPVTPDRDYVIGPQDLLAINVWHEPELSRSVPVRPDGKISMPLVGELNVSGLTPHLLEAHLAKELEDYVRNPQVTVMIQEANSHKFYIIGEVERPGAYPLTTQMTVLNALATAGGFRDFAKVQRIYLLRPMPDGSRKRMPFDYKAVVAGKHLTQDIELQSGDTVVVP